MPKMAAKKKNPRRKITAEKESAMSAE